MEHIERNEAIVAESGGISMGRRTLLKAGWTVPVIAATPLLNTASAMSSVNCAALQDRLFKHISDGNAEAANKIISRMIEGGCNY